MIGKSEDINNNRIYNHVHDLNDDDNVVEVDRNDAHGDDDMRIQPAWLRYLPQQQYIKVINKLPTNEDYVDNDDTTKYLTRDHKNIEEPVKTNNKGKNNDNNALSIPVLVTAITRTRSDNVTVQKQRKIFSTNPFSPYSQQVLKTENKIRNKKRTTTSSSLYDDNDDVDKNNNDYKYHHHHQRKEISKYEVVENYFNSNNEDEVYYYHDNRVNDKDTNSNEDKNISSTHYHHNNCNQNINNSTCHNKISSTINDDIANRSDNNYQDDSNSTTSTGKYKRQRKTLTTTTAAIYTSSDSYKHKHNINMMETSELFNFINLK